MRRFITSPLSASRKIPPDSLAAIVQIPRAQLSQFQIRALDIWEAVLKYELFGYRVITWREASLSPESRDRRWKRCPTCGRVLETFPTRDLSCVVCKRDLGKRALWGDVT